MPTPRCSGTSAGRRWRSRWRSPWCSGLTRLGARLVRLVPGAVVGQGAARHPGDPARRRPGHAPVRPGEPRQRAGVRADQPVAGRLAARPGDLAAGLVGVRRRHRAGRAGLGPSLTSAVAAVGRPGGSDAGRARARGSTPWWSSRCSTTSRRCRRGELRTKILALAEKEKVPVSDVLVADASRRTTTLNAYVSGFGSTRRVVLYDNLVDDVPERETLIVVAHELGHARHHDVATGTLLGAVGVLLRQRAARPAALAPAAARPGGCGGRRTAGGGGAAARPGRAWGACSRARSRTRSAGRWRPGPTGPRSRRPVTTAGSSGCRSSSPTRSLSDDDPPWLSQFWFGSHPTTLQRIGMARALEEQAR